MAERSSDGGIQPPLLKGGGPQNGGGILLLSEYDYNLPEELIAQLPADKRENSRMLVLNRAEHTISHKHFYDIVDFVDKNSLLVMNNTKVLPARLIGYKDTGAKIEVFLLKSVAPSPYPSPCGRG